MIFGAYNIDDPYEDRTIRTPSEIFIHDDWNPGTERFNDDIAILIIERDVPFTNFI
jgi:hypothetical protein